MFGLFKRKSEIKKLVEKTLKAPEVLVEMVDEIKIKAKRVYHMTSIDGVGGWGNQIAFSGNDENLRSGSIVSMTGFKQNIPRVDDVVLARMRSGNVSLFVFTKIKKCKNPSDMFFADAVLIGYDMNFMYGEEERLIS